MTVAAMEALDWLEGVFLTTADITPERRPLCDTALGMIDVIRAAFPPAPSLIGRWITADQALSPAFEKQRREFLHERPFIIFDHETQMHFAVPMPPETGITP